MKECVVSTNVITNVVTANVVTTNVRRFGFCILSEDQKVPQFYTPSQDVTPEGKKTLP